MSYLQNSPGPPYPPIHEALDAILSGNPYVDELSDDSLPLQKRHAFEVSRRVSAESRIKTIRAENLRIKRHCEFLEGQVGRLIAQVQQLGCVIEERNTTIAELKSGAK